jgi:hypothetical protein
MAASFRFEAMVELGKKKKKELAMARWRPRKAWRFLMDVWV